LPEIIGILGVDLFVVLSILTCLFDFPVYLQYGYHISAFVGFGQLWIAHLFGLTEESRFLIYVAYLVVALANIVFINGYVGAREKRLIWTTSLLCSTTVPTIVISLSLASWYVNRVPFSLPLLPMIPPEAVAAILFICIIILSISLFLSSFGLKLGYSPIPKKKKEVKTR
jgi:hypothetical protein